MPDPDNVSGPTAAPPSQSGSYSTDWGTDAPTMRSTPPGNPARYTLGDEIARGGMGVIYRATDTAFGREVAVKILQEGCASNDSAYRRFEDEARITAQLQHPNIPAVFERGTLPDGRPFLAMKLIRGDTLADLLARRPDPSHGRGRFVAAFEQVCQAVAFAHDRGIVHRDLKPGNVMVGAFGEVQVMDWGLAKDLAGRDRLEDDSDATAGPSQFHTSHDGTPLTQAGSALGTPAFMPPEQATGAVGQIDRRSDVFGLGGILAAVLTGRPPFAADSADAALQLAVKGEVQDCFAWLDGCGADPELVALCKRCLSPEKDDRPADAGGVVAAVASYLAGAEERLQQERLGRERDRVRAEEERRRRKLWLALAAAAVVAVGLASGGALYWQGQRAQRHREADQALDNAELHIRAGFFADAREPLARAKDRLGGAPADLAGRYESLQAAWQLAEDLRRIEQQRTTPNDEGSFDNATAHTSYLRTFADAGLDLFGDPDGAARLIDESPVRRPLLEAIDNWALVCHTDMRLLPRSRDENRRRRDGLLAVARAIEPYPGFHDRVRDPAVWGDRRQLEELAGRALKADPSPRLAALLAELLVLTKGDPEPLLRAFQGRYPDDFWLNFDLARRLDKKRPAEALRFYQAALALRPHHVVVQNHIGLNLNRTGDWDGAVAVLERALARLNDDDPAAVSVRNNLAVVFMEKSDLPGAVKLFERNLIARPNQTRTHLNVGRCLTRQGKFAEALEAARRASRVAAETGSPFRAVAEREVEEAERRAALARRMSAGLPEPADAAEALAFAEVYHCQGRYADAVGSYRRAFERNPKLAADLEAGERYNAASVAAMASSGLGNPPAPEGRRAEFRRQALDWLREDLDAWARLADQLAARPTVEAVMRQWQRQVELNGVRGDAIAQMPEGERQAWRRLWIEVRELLIRVQTG